MQLEHTTDQDITVIQLPKRILMADSKETRKSLQQVVENLLRRFVSQEWIAARMHEAID